MQKTKAHGLFAPKTASNNYYVHIEGTESDKMLAHCFAHIRNPLFYEDMLDLVESAWNLIDPSACTLDVHPSYTYLQNTLTFLLE